MSKTETMTVFGASGRTGRRVVDQAVARGWRVKAVSHEAHAESRDAVVPMVRDVLKDDLSAAMEGTDAVISCLGVGNDPATLLSPPPLYTDGTRRIVEAMQRSDVDRLVVMSASFVETFDRGPAHFRATLPALSKVFNQMKEMELFLESTETLRWTAVRPGWLMDGDATERARVTPGVIGADLIRSRTGDIARLMLDCVSEGTWMRGTPAIAAAEDDTETSVFAVLDEAL